MRIGQLAESAGTTTRAVRHYHRLGLLAEPRRQTNGYREYTISDAIRLIRIRWLADSGVPLGSVAALLADDSSNDDNRDVVDDLTALIGAVQREQAELARRGARLTTMLAAAESGNPISALPEGLAAAFTEAVESAESPAARAAIERERDLLEVLAITGKAPDQFLDGFIVVLTDPVRRAEYMALLAAWARLAGRRPESAEDEIDSLARRLLDAFADNQMVNSLSAGMTANGTDDDLPLPVEEVVPDAAQREVVLRVQRILVERAMTVRDAP